MPSLHSPVAPAGGVAWDWAIGAAKRARASTGNDNDCKGFMEIPFGVSLEEFELGGAMSCGANATPGRGACHEKGAEWDIGCR